MENKELESRERDKGLAAPCGCGLATAGSCRTPSGCSRGQRLRGAGADGRPPLARHGVHDFQRAPRRSVFLNGDCSVDDDGKNSNHIAAK